MRPTKISIIGAGFVGSSIAFNLMTSGLVSELILVDKNKDKALGEAFDLSQGIPLAKPVEIKTGDLGDCRNSDIIIITAGTNRLEGQTRLDLVSKNARIVEEIIPELVKVAPKAIYIMVTNPVDVLTFYALKISNLSPEQVIGSGTVLDTSRFRYALSKYFEIDSRNIHAYIVGEHGDSEVALWSLTNIAGIKLETFCSQNKIPVPDKDKILKQVKETAYKVIRLKGATYYAISLSVRRICEAILRDEYSVLTISSLIPGIYGINDVALSLPSIVGRKGRVKVLNLPLAKEEEESITVSAKILLDSQKTLPVTTQLEQLFY